MTKTRTLALRIAVSLTVTMFFLWLAFRGQDIHQLSHSLIEQPLLWFALLAALNIFSHLLRAIRWKMLIEPVKSGVTVHNAFASLMIGFMVNGFLPRAGELVRAYVLGRKEQIPTSSIFSTVILERILDIISFASVLCIVVLFNSEALIVWFPWLAGKELIMDAAALILLVLLMLMFVKSSVIFSLVRHLARLFPGSSRIERIIDSFVRGFKASTESKNYPAIALLTCTIWPMYVIILYLPLRLFGMDHLSLIAAVTLQLLSGLASALPTPNGIGSYHSFLAFTLTKGYGVSPANAIAYAVYTHAIYYFCILAVGAGYLLRENVRLTEIIAGEESNGQPAEPQE
ncbi:MAG: flippase-like domain-containing protein [Bacteroidetes bacterium]|nr:flippase-like domain-containing protein [Bacteroidota bacterium]